MNYRIHGFVFWCHEHDLLWFFWLFKTEKINFLLVQNFEQFSFLLTNIGENRIRKIVVWSDELVITLHSFSYELCTWLTCVLSTYIVFTSSSNRSICLPLGRGQTNELLWIVYFQVRDHPQTTLAQFSEFKIPLPSLVGSSY